MQPTKIKKFKLANSPINKLVLGKFLTDYPNLQIAEELMNGFQFGFRLHHHGPRVKTEEPNLPSYYKHSDIARDNIMKEIAKRRIAGPIKSRPMSTLRVSPLGVEAKKA